MVKTSFSPQMKAKLAAIFFVVTLVAVGYGLIYLRKLVGNVRASKIKVAEIERDLALIETIRNQLDQHAEEIARIRSTIPTKYYEVAYFTTQLERLAQNNGLEAQLILDKSQKDEGQTYNSILFSMDIKGSYPAVTEFLNQVYKLPFHTSIDALSMTKEKEELITTIKFRLFVGKNET